MTDYSELVKIYREHGAIELGLAADAIEALQAEVKRLRDFERHQIEDGMRGASRYWEERYRDEAAENSRLREALRDILPHTRPCSRQIGQEGSSAWHDWNDNRAAYSRARAALEGK